MATVAEGSAKPSPRRRPFGAAALPYLLSLPALLVCIGILVPFFTAVWYSLQRYNLAMPYLRGFVWFENYRQLFTDGVFWHTVSVSLLYTLLTVGLELLLGLGIALLLQRRGVFNDAMSIALLLPLMIAPAIAALMWKLMTNPNFGIFSYLLSLVGFDDMRWASSPSTALFTVVLVDVWVYTPFMMVLLLAGLRGLPGSRSRRRNWTAYPGPSSSFASRCDAVSLHPHGQPVSDAGRDPAIRHHLRHDARRPGDTLMVFRSKPTSNSHLHQRRRSAAMLMVLWVITYLLSHLFIKYWLRLREARAGRGLRGRCRATIRSRRPAHPDRAVLLVPDLLGRLDVVPDQRAGAAHPAEPVLRADARQLHGLDLGPLVSNAGVLEIAFMQNLWNSLILSTGAVLLSLLLGVPALTPSRATSSLGLRTSPSPCSRFASPPPLLVLLPLTLYFQDIGLNDTYVGLIWVYQLITLPLILWIVRSYFEDISPDIEHGLSRRRPQLARDLLKISIPLAQARHRLGGPPLVHLCLEQLRLRAGPGLGRQAAGDGGALAFVTASGIQYGQIAAAVVLSILPTLALALYAQRYLVEGLSLGAVKG